MPFKSSLDKFANRVFERIDNLYNCILDNRRFQFGAFAFVALFFCIAIYAMNVKTPMVIDDFSYSMNSSGGYIQGLKDIIESQYNHYFDWGGRVVVHIIAQVLLFIPPCIADVINSLAFLLCIYLMYLHILGRKGKHDIILFALIAILMWLLQPAFGESILWLTGSANYVFGMILVLSFLLPFRLYVGEEGDRWMKTKMFLALPLGLIAGWTNENTAAAMIAMLVLFFVFYKTEGWKIPNWGVLGLIGAVIGYTIMILAPGNHVRSVTIGLEYELTVMNLFSGFFLGTRSFIEYMGVFNLFGLIFLILYKHFKNSKSYLKEGCSAYIIYMLGTLVAIYIMIFSPLFPPRAWFGIVVYNIIAVGVIFNSLDYSQKFFRAIKYTVGLVIIVVLFPFTYHCGYKDVSAIDEMLQERFRIIENAPDNGESLQFDFIEAQTKFGTSDTPFVESAYSAYFKRKIEIR